MMSAVANPTTCESCHLNTVDALVDYLTDCEFDESRLNSMSLALAMEYTYQPHPRFWRDFTMKFVIDAVTRLFPDWRFAPGETTRRTRRLKRATKEILRINRFDEANAEMIGALPVHERPSDAAAAFTWICAQYRRKRQFAELAFAQKDGWRCGNGALTVLECLESAQAGRPFERIGAMVAHSYRDAMLKQREKAARN